AESKLNDAGANFFRLAPITGAVENVGWRDEESFYTPFLKSCAQTKISLSIGDGVPDEKLIFGINAVRALAPQRAAVFLKPYPQEKLFERIEWAADVAEFFGVDIDAYNIATMRGKAHLEKKSASQLRELRRAAKIPFVVKGVFTKEDLRLVEELRPDVALVSNHGGRVETEIGSTAEFLQNNFAFLKKHCGQVWVDGGIRTRRDAIAAAALGAEQILLGRPLISAFCKNGEQGVKKICDSIFLKFQRKIIHN
ncbi:MAG: alpha-hydroxy-acid oxidizing protein, partial [Lachnospiraceae bacterium]|nr:alpha-hydroxy-acid oxidizing protein [Lachnospiraceae bacterium]